MASFTDKNGRRWSIAIDGSHVINARRTFNVYLPGMFTDGNKPLQELLGDFEKFVGTLWICCEEQAIKAGVTEMEFAAGLGGDTFKAATDAFIEALIDFFPQAAQRAALKAAWKAEDRLLTEAMQTMATTIQKSITSGSSNSESSPESTAAGTRSGSWFGWRKGSNT